MKIETATRIRMLLSQVEAIIASELAAATPIGVVTDPPTGVTDSPPVVSTGSPIGVSDVINGFRRFADSDGFVTIPEVDAVLARLPPSIATKLPTRFAFEQAYRQATFPNDIAREKCERNMIARWRSPIQVPPEFSWTARLVKATPIPSDLPADFNSLPERRADYLWDDSELLMNPGNVAYSADCNPATQAPAFVALVKARARDELTAVGLVPSDYGL